MPRTNVRTWMTPHPITVAPKDSILTAYSLMKRHHIRRLPVVDGDGLVGIVTINDLRSAAPMGELGLIEHNDLLAHTPVARAMTPDPITIDPDTHVSEAARLLMKHKVGGLPVVENSWLVGVISESDIFRRTIAESWTPGETEDEAEGEETVDLGDATRVFIRPITPEDAPRLQQSHALLSQETVYDRFMGYRKILPDEEARYLSGLDYDSHMALIATTRLNGEETIVGVARYILMDSEPGLAEFAIVINDSFQRHGLGSILMHRLARYAAAHGVTTFLGLTHNDNLRFLRFAQSLGFPAETKKQQGYWEVRLDLTRENNS